VLIFNCTNGRSGEEFLGTILNQTKILLSAFASPEAASTFFDQVIFCSNVTYTDGHFKGGECGRQPRVPHLFIQIFVDLTSVAIATAEHTGPTTQDQLKTAWLRLVEGFSPEAVHSLPSIEHAIRKVREFSSTGNISVLVTGSLHLIGGIIEVAGLSSDALGDL
jgi:folylpolyglutamate synthase